MVINTHYKFIFVHIPKAAGTSVMKSLEQIEGSNKRWLANTKHETLVQFRENIDSRLSQNDRLSFQHPKDYFTFGFVRNPWDRMSSFYRYLVEKRPKAEIDSVSSFNDFLHQAHEGVVWIQGLHSMKSQLDYFTLRNNQMEIDFVGHFECLGEDINSVSQKIGFPISLAHENRSSNTARDYRMEYNSEMIDIVASRFSEEIELFGYSFEEKLPTRRCSGRLNRRR